MFHTRLRGEKAFTAEQKLRVFRKLLSRGKRLEKQYGRRLKPLDLIRKVTQHMNNINSTKHELAPETIEKRSLDPNDGEYFQEIYDFMRLRKIGTNQLQNEKYNDKIGRRKKKLRSPLNLDEKVLVLVERLKKKDVPGSLYKASTETIPFFNRDRIFIIYKRAKLENGVYLYWLQEKGRKINERFLRREPFVLNNQFLR